MNSSKAGPWQLLMLICVSFLVTCWAKAQSASDPNEGFQMAYDSTNQVYDLKWWGKPGRTYFLQESQDLLNWTWVPVIESGNNAVIEWGFSTNATSLFFRLRYSDIPTTDPEDADFDGDGVSNWNEIQAGSDPLNYYSQPGPSGSGPILITPNLTIVSGNNQLSTSGALTPQPLVVQVTNSNGGAALVNAPATFTVAQGGGEAVTAGSSSAGTSLTVQTASDGTATIYYQQPPVDGTTSLINATTDELINEQIVTFTENSGLPAAVTGLTASSTNSDEIDLSWSLPSINDATSLVLEESTDGGITWTMISTLNADSTSYSAYNLDPTQFYEFQIVSSNSFGISTSGVSQSEAPVPSPPTGLTYSIDNTADLTLSWIASAGATSYLIEREPLSTGTWTALATTTNTQYPDTTRESGAGYHYRVSALTSSGTSTPSTEFPISRYAVIDIEAGMSPTGMNNSGDVVGNDGNGPVLWHNGNLTNLVIPTPASPPASADFIIDDPSQSTTVTSLYLSADGINDSGTITGTQMLTVGNDEAFIWGQGICWATGTAEPTDMTYCDSLTWPESGGQYLISNSNTVVGNVGNLVTYTDPSVTPARPWVANPAVDQVFPVVYPSGSPPLDNTQEGWTQSNSYFTALNRVGDYCWQSGQLTSEAPDPSNNNNPSFSNFVLYNVQTSSGTVTQLPFSWYVSSFTDTTPYAYVGIARHNGFSGTGHIYDNGQDVSLGFGGLGATGGIIPSSINSPTDSSQTQIVGYNITDGVNGVLLEKGVPPNSPDGTAPTWNENNRLYLSDLLPAGNSWSSVQAQFNNNNGAMAGVANYNPGPNDSTPSGSHCIALLPVQFVRETPPGSGTFTPIKDNGLDNQAQLPVYDPAMANSLTTDVNWSGGYLFTVQLAQNLSTTSATSMTAAFQNSTGTYTGTLTETSSGSGVFQDSANAVTITLTPPAQTTSNSFADKLQVQVTDSALGLTNAPFTLGETGPATLSFVADIVLAEVDLSGPLSTTAVNTIQVHLSGSEDTNVVETPLTETGVNTRIFTRPQGDITVTINNLSGTAMQISVQDNFLQAQSATLALTETSSTSNAFANVSATLSTFTPLDPGSSGEGVFYIQLPSSGTSSIPITVSSGTNSVTVNASPVSGSPNLSRTSGIVLLAPGTSGNYSGITTLQTDATANTICFSIFGTKIDPPKTTAVAFIGRELIFEMGADPNGGLLDTISGNGHLNRIEKTLIGSASANISGLGWTVTKVQTVRYTDVIDNVAKCSLFYVLAHGVTPTGDNSSSFAAFGTQPGPGIDVKHPLDLFSTQPVTPLTISTFIENASYQLVFINGCASADDTSPGGVPMAFAKAFKNDTPANDPSNVQNTSYVGWSDEVGIPDAIYYGEHFFTALQKDPQTGVIPEVQDAVRNINAQIDAAPANGFTTLGGTVPHLVAVTGLNQQVDLNQ